MDIIRSNPITLGGGVSGSLVNVPISISMTEPVPERVGHLWIVSDIENQVTKIEFNGSLNTSATDGTLQLIVPITVQHIDLSQYMKIGTRKVLGVLESGNVVSQWIIGDIEKNNEHCKLYVDAYPLVYFTKDSIRHIENAYIWSGTEWFMCCQKDVYLYLPRGDKAGLYNIINHSFTLENNIISNSEQYKLSTISPKGGYIFDTVNRKILKKYGDTYQEWLNCPTNYQTPYALWSSNESLMAISTSNTTASIYKIVSDGLVEIQSIVCNGNNGLITHRIAFLNDNETMINFVPDTNGKASSDIYKIDHATGIYKKIASYSFTSQSMTTNSMGVFPLTSNEFVVYFMRAYIMYKVILNNDGTVSNVQTIFTGTAQGSGSLNNFIAASRDGKWIFWGSYSTNLGMDLNVSSYSSYDRRGSMVVINTQTGKSQIQNIYDGAVSVRCVFDTGESNIIKVLCAIENYGFVIVTWEDTGANTLTYIKHDKIRDMDGVVFFPYCTACPVISQ